MIRAKFRAGWRSRQESAEGAARKTVGMFKEFGVCLQELLEWSCDPPPFRAAPLTENYFSTRFERSAKKDKSSDLGYSLVAWAGTKDRAFGLNMGVGSTSGIIKNVVHLNFPPDMQPDVEVVRCVLSTLVRIWEPDFAAYNPVVRIEEKRFELGELVFLSNEIEAYLGDLSCEHLRREPFESANLYHLTPAEIGRVYKRAQLTATGPRPPVIN